MPAGELRWLASLALLGAIGCDSEPREPIAPSESKKAEVVGPAVVLEDPDAREPQRESGSERVLPDLDQSPPSAPLQPPRREVLLASGTVLVLADPTLGERRRAALEAELGPRPSIGESELAKLRVKWFRSGTGIVFQNTTDHSFRLAVHFSSSVDPQCEETVLRTRIEPKNSSAPSPSASCGFDTAIVTLFDANNIAVGTVTLHPEDP